MFLEVTNLLNRNVLFNLENIIYFEDVESCYSGPKSEAKTCIHTNDGNSHLICESLEQIMELIGGDDN
jgi:hypothetical protein